MLSHAPQNRVYEPGVAAAPAVSLRQPYSEVDRRVVGHIKKQDLYRSEQQHSLNSGSIPRKAAAQHIQQHMPQCAEPPKNCCDEPANERAIPIGESCEPRVSVFAVELFVERPATAEDTVNDIGGYPPRAEPGDVLLRARHA